MEFSLDLWFEYILRFSHLVAGIAWIGSSFYFIWLDRSFLPPESPRKNVEGEVFMVHGGFYYQVEKKKIYPGEIPKTLHWFKWEATITLITGYFLLAYLYFFNGASLLIDPQVAELTQFEAVGLCVALIVGSWFVYDLVWNSSIVRSQKVSLVLSVLFFGALMYATMQLFSGRGAYIIIGAIFGSLMVLNVWVRILPGQSKMLKEAQAGEIPDYSVSIKSKVRSVHNTYFTFPVLFIMLSNHYPQVYNHEFNWLLLIVLGVSGALARHAMVTEGKNKIVMVVAALGLGFLIYITAQSHRVEAISEATLSTAPEVPYSEIASIIEKRCVQCHSTNNTDDIFKVAQKGVILESKDQVLKHANMIINQVRIRVMPLGNKTQMTEAERETLVNWLMTAKP